MPEKKDRFILGLTGGIGTGKSTAAQYIVSRGFRHIDADEIGRELTRKGSPILTILDETFGPFAGACKGNILTEDGSLDRKALAAIVFSDPLMKKKLDDIMFAEIGRIIGSRIEEAEGSILLDAPLLFEAELDRFCDAVLLLTCDLETRLQRVGVRDGASRREILARINAQMPDEEKAKRSDYVIDNSRDLKELHRSLDHVIDSLKPVSV